MEALLRLLNWQTFFDAMKDDQEVRSLEQVVSTATMEVQKDVSTCTIQRLYDASELEKLHAKFNKYNESTSKMGRYWLSYVEMVSLLLRFVRSTREGCRGVFLQATSYHTNTPEGILNSRYDHTQTSKESYHECTRGAKPSP